MVVQISIIVECEGHCCIFMFNFVLEDENKPFIKRQFCIYSRNNRKMRGKVMVIVSLKWLRE